jgi:hypothetical protein
MVTAAARTAIAARRSRWAEGLAGAPRNFGKRVANRLVLQCRYFGQLVQSVEFMTDFYGAGGIKIAAQ